MRYLIAIFCPPLAILLCGRIFLAILSIPLCIFIFPPMLLALLVVSDHKANLRADRTGRAMAKALGKSNKEAARESRAQTDAIVRATEAHTRAIQAQTRAIVAATAPAAIPAPAPAPSASPSPAPNPAPPARPRLTIADVRDALVSAKVAAIRAYRDLPEWGQPICWGLAGGSALSVPFVCFMLSRA